MSDHIGRRRVLVILSVWYAVAIAGLLAVDGSVAVVAMLLFWGLALNAVFPIFYAITADNAPEATGSAMGLLLMLTFFGQVPASPLAGYLIDHYGGYKQIGGYVAGFAIAVAACLLSAILIGVVARGRRTHHDVGVPAGTEQVA